MKKEISEKIQEEEDFWDKFKELPSKSSLNMYSIKNFNFLELSFDNDNLEEVKKWGDNTCDSLGDEDREIELEDKNCSFKPV